MDDPKPIIHAEISVANCDAEILINDIPITRAEHERNPFTSLPVHPLIIDGDNTLTLIINPGKTPATAQTPETGDAIPAGVTARARIVLYAFGDTPSDEGGRTILETRYGVADEPERPGPWMQNITGRLPMSFGRREWERAKPIRQLTPQTIADALNFLNTIRDAFQKGEIRPLAPLFARRILEAAESYGANPRAELEGFINRWETGARIAGPDWKLAPITPETASLRLCAEGKLIDCVGTDWLPLLRTIPVGKTGRSFIGIRIARSGNSWEVLR